MKPTRNSTFVSDKSNDIPCISISTFHYPGLLKNVRNTGGSMKYPPLQLVDKAMFLVLTSACAPKS